MKPEPLKGKYEEYSQRLWWDKLANQRLSTEASEIFEDIRLACEFYLKYSDDPNTLFKRHRNYIQYFELYLQSLEKSWGWWHTKYAKSKKIEDNWLAEMVFNDWLFKFAFYDLGYMKNNLRINNIIKMKELYDLLSEMKKGDNQ